MIKAGDAMLYLTPEQIKKVKQLDLLTYLKKYDPNELVYINQNNYTTKTHDSLKISNGLWNWFSAGIGGKTALEYLIQVKGYKFIEAANHIMNLEHINMYEKDTIKQNTKATTIRQTKLVLPPHNINNNIIIKYLKNRKISEEVIKECIARELVYEDNKHNLVMIGYNENKEPIYAGIRATTSSRFMHDVTGSNKSYSFRIADNKQSNELHIFEGAIDLMSFASLLLLKGIDYKKYNMLSLAGVYQPAKVITESKVPKAISEYLTTNKNISKVILHLDNDKAGRLATKALNIVLAPQYKVLDRAVPFGKDVNEYLQMVLGQLKNKSVLNNTQK